MSVYPTLTLLNLVVHGWFHGLLFSLVCLIDHALNLQEVVSMIMWQAYLALIDQFGGVMFSTVWYQREDGTEGEEAYESEKEACLALEKAFYQHHARGRKVSVETREDGTRLYVVRDADGQTVEKHELIFGCSEVA